MADTSNYENKFEPTEIKNTTKETPVTIENVIKITNDNFKSFSDNSDSTLVHLESDIASFADELKPIATNAAAANLDFTGETRGTFATDEEKTAWTSNQVQSIHIQIEDSSASDYGTVYQNDTDVTYNFKKVIGYPVDISDLENNVNYIAQRDVFNLYNVTVSNFTTNTDSEDSEFFPYQAVVDLSEYLYKEDGSNKNNCIYQEEYKHIEEYVAVIALTQESADHTLSKISKSIFANGIATITFSIADNTKNLTIKSILFLRDKRNQLPSDCNSIDYLESVGTGSLYTNLTKGGYIAQLSVMLTDFNESTDFNTIIGNKNNFGVKNNNGTWYWAFRNNGTDLVSSSPVTESILYHLYIINLGGVTMAYVNGSNVINGSLSLASGTSKINLFAGLDSSNTLAYNADMRLYSAKIYGADSNNDMLIVGDYILCSKDNTGYLFDIATNTLISGTNITPGITPNIADYILVGNSTPKIYTKGVVGQFYRVRNTNDYYICTEVNGIIYTWEPSFIAYTYEE